MYDTLTYLNKCLYCGNDTHRIISNNEYHIDCVCKNNIFIDNDYISNLNIKKHSDYIIRYEETIGILSISYIISDRWHYHIFDLQKFNFELLKLIYNSNCDDLIQNITIYLLFS